MDYEKKKRLAELRDGMKSYGYMDGVEELEDILPELRESEDEKTRKFLIDFIKLENGANLSPDDAKRCIAYLEKQKDVGKAIEAVERIDKYIDEHTANANDMKDSDPDKKYYSGVDDTLSNIAGILNSAYSEEKQKEQKSAEMDNEETELSDFESELFSAFSDGWQQYLHGEEVDVARWAKEHSAELLDAAKLELKHTEWSDEDKDYYDAIIGKLEVTQDDAMLTDNQMDFLKSLPERFNLQPKQESEPMKIKYAGKIYKVYGTKEFPCGVIGYKIKDEPGQFDYIINPDEVLGGGYDIKSKETPYPAKEANLDQPHWKPSEEQMIALKKGIGYLAEYGRSDDDLVLNTLYDDLNKLYSL